MSRRFWSMLIALAVFTLSVLYMGPLTQWAVERFWIKPGAMEYTASSLNPLMFQGTILQRKALETPNLTMVYGSSELGAAGSWSEFYPNALFAGKPTGFLPFLVGRGGCQDLLHVLNTAAQGDALRGKKVAVILSSQWFTPQGITLDYMAANFSPLQAYRMLFNPTLNLKTKRQVADRLLQFPEVFKDYPVLSKMLSYYGRPDAKARWLTAVYMPLARIEMASLELQDAAKTIRYLQQTKPKAAAMEQEIKEAAKTPLKPWDQLREEAAQKAKAAVTTNSFGIMDSYYNEYVKPNLASSQNSAARATLYPSPEYNDLRLLCNVLQQEGAKPLFVIVPVNGFWYDYTGFPKSERDSYYKRVKQMIQDQGFAVADFSNHEYDMYFLKDIMHMGMKGWVNLDEALDRFVHQGV